MKKLLVVLITAIFFIPSSYCIEKEEKQEQEYAISFAFDTNGTGYSIPTGINFIMGRHIVLWYYEEGHTKSFVPSFEINGSQFGVGILLFGIWKAPSLWKQPGNITGVGIGIVIIFKR